MTRMEELVGALNSYESLCRAQANKRDSLLKAASIRISGLYDNIENWLHPVRSKVVCTRSESKNPLMFDGVSATCYMLTIEIAGKTATFEPRIQGGELEFVVTGLDRARAHIIIQDPREPRPILDQNDKLLEHFSEDYLIRKLISLVDLV